MIMVSPLNPSKIRTIMEDAEIWQMFICNKGLGPIKFLGVFGEPHTWLVQLSFWQ